MPWVMPEDMNQEEQICVQLITDAITSYKIGENLVIPLFAEHEARENMDSFERGKLITKVIRRIIAHDQLTIPRINCEVNGENGTFSMEGQTVIALLLRDALLERQKLIVTADNFLLHLAATLNQHRQQGLLGDLEVSAISDEQTAELISMFSENKEKKTRIAEALVSIGYTNALIFTKLLDLTITLMRHEEDMRFCEPLVVVPSRYKLKISEENIPALEKILQDNGIDYVRAVRTGKSSREGTQNLSPLAQIKQLIADLSENIKDKKNGRKQWFNSGSDAKAAALNRINEWLESRDHLNDSETNVILSLVKSVCETKRNSMGLYSPHSLNEFNQFISARGWKMPETSFNAKELAGITSSEKVGEFVQSTIARDENLATRGY
ncbi:hypothetical protein B1207_08280 [Legionella quinlivanii]|uniref:Uncharacterized protein n=1 Tax=Legionella quinlivanii TaxID=45073 RepID=A0A364LJW1_9GAMM|nr:hypothetical protein [Legionella quinlivanii]RAP36785.1 hypothetical protein B1207_08280 [Legionella quinlivanii]